MTADRMTEKEARERCDHICFLDAGHVARGEPHQYCYENPPPRADPTELGRRWTPEQLTACLKGAEEVGKVGVGVVVPYGVEWRSGYPSDETWAFDSVGMEPVWRIVPDEEEGTT